jgi:general nucleoside transport system permease protein
MTDSLLVEGAIRLATPLVFAALGETVTERAGVLNIGLEGCIIAGALGGVVLGTYGGVVAGFSGAVLCGLLIAAIFALFVVGLQTDHIITGTACNLLAFGATSTVYRTLQDPAGLPMQVSTVGSVPIPVLSELPVLGNALFRQTLVVYLLYALVPLTFFWLNRTYGGLHLRAVGEDPQAALAAGIRPKRIRLGAILFGGALGGMAGGVLVLAQTGTFVEGMSAGRGFIAIAIVALGRWSPPGVLAAAVIFGAASATQFYFQVQGWKIPYQLFLSLPYVLTLGALAIVGKRSIAPRALGRQDPGL